ncbi:GTP-binding protein GEM [Caerostris extrusa]|uniref:GTP-binding protein GEM n=1 Tax=Caerostris extrusa TaxID=172846 RepID=A0AAV4VZE6_CAEEX|nr:GTP-binding protein GEM [Caerostris extrusa]
MKEEADAYIVAYSVTDRASFEKAVDILFSLRERGITNSKAVILVGNKSDLARTREIAVEEGKAIACSYECKFIETSAAINHNVDELLVGMVSQIRLKNRQKEKEENNRPAKTSSPSTSPFKKGVEVSKVLCDPVYEQKVSSTVFLVKAEGPSPAITSMFLKSYQI